MKTLRVLLAVWATLALGLAAHATPAATGAPCHMSSHIMQESLTTATHRPAAPLDNGDRPCCRQPALIVLDTAAMPAIRKIATRRLNLVRALPLTGLPVKLEPRPPKTA